MNLIRPAFVTVLCLISGACSRKSEKNLQLVEANRLHLEAVAISEELEARLDSLSVQVKDDMGKSQIDSLQNLIEVWEENVIEVPGFAHEHPHGAHSHKSAPPMTAESMLDYQRQSREAILELKETIEKLNNPHK